MVCKASRPMIPAVSSVSGQCSVTKSLRRSIASTDAASTPSGQSACLRWRLNASTLMPKASAISATRRPMAPKPMMPTVLPASSKIGVTRREKSGQACQPPCFTQSLKQSTRLAKYSIIAKVSCATLSVL